MTKTAAQIMAEAQANIAKIDEILSDSYCFRCDKVAAKCRCGIFANISPFSTPSLRTTDPQSDKNAGSEALK